MRSSPYAAITIALFVASGCAKQPARPGATPSASASPNPAAYLGTGHLALAGSVILTHDVTVKGCWVSAPGSSVLNGYSVTFARDAVIESGGVLVKQYDHDGVYVIDPQEQYAALALFLADQGSSSAVVLTDTRGSLLKVTIGDHGRSGSALFSHWNGGKGHPAEISGAIDWKCGAVRHT